MGAGAEGSEGDSAEGSGAGAAGTVSKVPPVVGVGEKTWRPSAGGWASECREMWNVVVKPLTLKSGEPAGRILATLEKMYVESNWWWLVL